MIKRMAFVAGAFARVWLPGAMSAQETVVACPSQEGLPQSGESNGAAGCQPAPRRGLPSLGRDADPLPWGEVYGALQTGIIQGQENPGFFLESTKMYEVTDVITCLGHNNFTTAVMANEDFYDSLPEEDQLLIQGAIEAAFNYILEYQEGLQEEALAKIKEAKPEMEVNILSEEQRKVLMEAAHDVEQIFIQMTGECGKRILDQMKEDFAAVQD